VKVNPLLLPDKFQGLKCVKGVTLDNEIGGVTGIKTDSQDKTSQDSKWAGSESTGDSTS
jgi:hypothetical protein